MKDGRRRRRQHGRAPAGGRPAERRPRRRADLPSDLRGDRLPRGGAGRRRRGRASRSAPGRRSRPARASASTSRGGRSRRSSAAAASSSCSSRRWRACARSARRSWSRSSACPGSARAGSSSSSSGRSRRTPRSSRWRQGRSLPYGEGVTFWALARDRQGAGGHPRERQRRSRPRRSSRARVGRFGVDATEGQWLERHLRPLAGLAEEEPTGAEEGFAAWRRFLEAWPKSGRSCSCSRTCTGPTTRLLEFVDQLVERSERRPVARARDGAPRAPAAAAGLGRWQAERAIDLALAALGRGDRPACPGVARAAASSTRRPRRRCSPVPEATRSTPSSTPGSCSSGVT